MPHGVLAEMTTKSAGKTSSSAPSSKVSEFYGCNVFGVETMKLLLPKETFRQVQDAIHHDERFPAG